MSVRIMKRAVLVLAAIAIATFAARLSYYVLLEHKDVTFFKVLFMIALFYYVLYLMSQTRLLLTCAIQFRHLDKESIEFMMNKAVYWLLWLYTGLVLYFNSYFPSRFYVGLAILAPLIVVAMWLLLTLWLIPAAIELFWLVAQFLLHGRYRSFSGLVMPLYNTNSLPLSMSFRGNRLTPLFHRINAYDSLYEYIMRSVDAAFSGKSMRLLVGRRKNGIFVVAVKWWRVKIPVTVVLMHLSPDVDVQVHARVYVLWGMFNKASKIKVALNNHFEKPHNTMKSHVRVRVTCLV